MRTTRRTLLTTGLAATLAVGAALAGETLAADASHEVLRGGDVVAGRTVRAWTAAYTTWDVDRAKRSDCQTGQRGRMFFLPTSDGGVDRATCSVPAGRPVMIMPAGIECWDFETKAELVRECLAPSLRRLVTRVEVSIDGSPVRVRASDWVRRHGFRAGGTPAAVSCYCYVIRGLAPGAHEIELYDEVKPPDAPLFRARMTVKLNVI